MKSCTRLHLVSRKLPSLGHSLCESQLLNYSKPRVNPFSFLCSLTSLKLFVSIHVCSQTAACECVCVQMTFEESSLFIKCLLFYHALSVLRYRICLLLALHVIHTAALYHIHNYTSVSSGLISACAVRQILITRIC